LTFKKLKATSSQKSQKIHSEWQREKFCEKPPKAVFIDIHLFRKGAGETEKQRENSLKNAENFAEERE
jgi:hypothetical protein